MTSVGGGPQEVEALHGSPESAPNEAPVRQTFFRRAALLLLVMFGLPIAIGHLAGRAYKPQRLAAPRAAATQPPRVVLFGNSRFQAAIDPEQLARELGGSEAPAKTISFTGGGWDQLHFYQLARLNVEKLRPGRDAVVIEVSPLSCNDTLANNRLGAIRAEAAPYVISLPGLPVEARLDVTLGALAPLYRYRLSIQRIAVLPRLKRLSGGIGRALSQVGLVGPPRALPDFELVTAPDRDFVIQEVKGDRASFTTLARAQIEEEIRYAKVGGYKVEALRRSVKLLRERGVDVYLLQVPTSGWLAPRLARSPAGRAFDHALREISATTGARWLHEWPASFSDGAMFWDEQHMTAAATRPFTETLARRLTEERR